MIMSDDLEVLPEDGRKEGSFGTGVVDSPGSAGTRRKANVTLSTYSVAQQESIISRRRRNACRRHRCTDPLRRRVGGRAEGTSQEERGCGHPPKQSGFPELPNKVVIHSFGLHFFYVFFCVTSGLRGPCLPRLKPLTIRPA
jgi:hypothetical protein